LFVTLTFTAQRHHMNDSDLKIAIQKSGRLSEQSLDLIKTCGIHFLQGTGKLTAHASNFPAHLLFLRDDDIPGYVADEVADVGIVGLNVLEEKQQGLTIYKKLAFGQCRLSIAVTKGIVYEGVQSLQHKRIATSYPKIVKRFLAGHGVEADLHEISGSVEIAPSIGLADAIVDLVSSGSTLMSNGLVEVETILRSEAVLVGKPNLSPEKQALLDKLLFRMDAVQTASDNKYILLNAPESKLNKIIEALPGLKSPTVLPLAQEGWVSLHTVINENEFWDKIDLLRNLGAEGILVIPIEKMIR